ncbi:MAG: SRPBCC family protein [Cytophaga sp.]|uniref:SRPBCC family protein n=1 Tax=Cytophaga sp. TaxID=29535 RepID=UPI003F8140F3
MEKNIDQPVIVERTFNAPASKVWKALTDKEEMKKWYFDLSEFKAEKGFVFQFSGGPEDGIQYVHVCEVTEAIPEKKLTYSWRYEGYAGKSYVTFELSGKEDQTSVKLTHTDIDSFPEQPDFARANFAAGWDHILNVSLKEYLEGKK